MTKSAEPLRIGIAGLGNVGVGLVKLVQAQSDLRMLRPIEIAAVSARSRSRDRGIDLSAYEWFDDPMEIATHSEVDVYVELMGGSDGPAKRTVEAALGAGKHVVTANKALIAEHGEELAILAEKNNAHLEFEAAVAGGIPIVRTLRDSLSGVKVNRISGILNGTCNYILSTMLETGAAYDDVLKDAQRLGYAEADPFLDVSGTDAAHKIVILAAIAFKAKPDFSKVRIQGVSDVTDLDIQSAAKLGFRVRLVAEAVKDDQGVRCFTAATLFPEGHPLAMVTGPTNAVLIEGDGLGQVTLTGPGAGQGPTASAVMGDIAKVAAGGISPGLGVSAADLDDRFTTPTGEGAISKWFLRARLKDEPGTLALLSDALADSNISIDKLLQDSAGESGLAPVAIVSHPCTRRAAETAISAIQKLEASVDAPMLMRIES